MSRRELLRRGVAGAASVAVGPSLFACSTATSAAEPRIVIVGAGLAGLSCAYRLHRSGVPTTVYEANPDRIGGRCWTSRDWANGQIAEHGGEFIDSRHRLMRGLADDFGLELTDIYRVPNPGGLRLWLNGGLVRRSAMRSERRLFERLLGRDARRIGPYDAGRHSRAAVEFDQLSAADWMDERLPGGSGSDWGQYVWAELASEFGLDADRLSAINLILQFWAATPGADERFHVKGGNDQIVHGLAESLPGGTIRQDAPLEALFERRSGYGLRFAGLAEEVMADRVVLAIPFTTLREVDLDGAGLSAKKRRCIDELGMGTNAKILMQFAHRPRAYGDWSGYLGTDDPFLLTWESTLGEPGSTSVITTFPGGRSGAQGVIADEPHAPALPSQVDRTLTALTQTGRMRLAGLADGFSGRAFTDHWTADPWARGSYAAYLPGQVTKYRGFVGKREGSIHFAGEHTATVNQGYLEGAVESGERCAAEILKEETPR